MENKKLFKMAKDYDMENDSLFMHITDKYEYKESLELGNNIILDFDKNYVPVAIEILDGSKFLGVGKFSLKNLLKLKIGIEIDSDFITIKASFILSLHQKEIDAPVNVETSNDINLLHVQTEFALA